MSMHKLISGAVLGAALAVAGHDATAQPSLPQPRISAPPLPVATSKLPVATSKRRWHG